MCSRALTALHAAAGLTRSLGAMEETIECDVRYLRVSGVDVYGYGPSERSWKYDLRLSPSERRIVIIQPHRRCQVSLCYAAGVYGQTVAGLNTLPSIPYLLC